MDVRLWPALTAAVLSGCVTRADVGAAQQFSVCNGVEDWQHVAQYDGTLGPSVAFVSRHESAVGHLSNVSDCTGTLISRDLFLTAGHCDEAFGTGGNDFEGAQVIFNYQNDAMGNPESSEAYDVLAEVEDENGGLDYAILRLDGTPGDVWGYAIPSALAAPAGQYVTIIQHPNGEPKQIEAGPFDYRADGRVVYSDIDTIEGSSGAGLLLNSSGYLVGVHFSGPVENGVTVDCDSNHPNVAESMVSIHSVSPTISMLAIDPAKLNAIF